MFRAVLTSSQVGIRAKFICFPKLLAYTDLLQEIGLRYAVMYAGFMISYAFGSVSISLYIQPPALYFEIYDASSGPLRFLVT